MEHFLVFPWFIIMSKNNEKLFIVFNYKIIIALQYPPAQT